MFNARNILFLMLVLCSNSFSWAEDSSFNIETSRLLIPYIIFQNNLYQAELSYIAPDKLKLENVSLLDDLNLNHAKVPVYDNLSFHLSSISVVETEYAADMNFIGDNLFQIRNLKLTSDLPVGDTLFTSQHFSGSGLCALCHNNLQDDQGNDVSLETAWKTSMMANSTRDPFWQAKVKSELNRTPNRQDLINDTCTRCHSPMANEEARKQKDVVQSIFDQGLLNENNPYHDQFLDGVSCSICHQISPNGNFGTDAGYSGNYSVATFQNSVDRLIYGPYDGVNANPMRNFADFTPVFSEHIKSSELCASCHDLTTPYTDDQGNLLSHTVEDQFPEQMPYSEWLHSDFADSVSCQQCHMERANGVAIPFVNKTRNDFAQHTFLGSNILMLSILEKYNDQLGVTATDFSGDILKAEKLHQDAANMEIKDISLQNSTLNFNLSIESKTGHKLPSGYPSHRIIVHVTVRDQNNKIVFETGKVNPDGSVNELDSDINNNHYEPHYQLIESPSQVQVYEAVMQDYQDQITFTLLRAKSYRKDNRLLPKGFDKTTAPNKIKVRGLAENDVDFSAGGDTLEFKVNNLVDNNYTITAELIYQTLGYAFSQDLFEDQSLETSRFKQMFNASNLKSHSMLTVQVSFTN